MTEYTIPAGYTLTPFLSETRKTEFSSVGNGIEAGKSYQAIFETSEGRLVIDLYADKAPVTVGSFAYLIRNHFYDGIIFHRVIADFMAQTGDPTGTGRGGPGYRFKDEFHPELKHDRAGTLSMANSGPGTNGSQIFITFGPTPHLNGGHSVFGRIVDGIENLARIKKVDPSFPIPYPTVIERAYIVEKPVGFTVISK